MNKFIQQLIIHHFNGTTSKKDEERLEKWLQESEENRAEFEEMKQTWQETQDFFEIDSKNIEEDTDVLEDDSPLPNNDYPKRNLYKDLLQMGVGILLLIGIVWGINSFIKPANPIIPTQKIQTFQNDYHKLTLEDGTKVWLNQNTILTIPENFGSEERRVRLFGEAFFEVTKDENRPFIVFDKKTQISSFLSKASFNARTNNERVSVSVKAGEVQLTSRGDKTNSIRLKAEEKGIFSVKTNMLEKQTANLKSEMFWIVEEKPKK